MITISHDELHGTTLNISDEAVLQNALVCYREALAMDLAALIADGRMDRIAQSTERTIAQVDHLLEVLA